MEEICLVVEAEEDGVRADYFLADRCKISRSRAASLIESGHAARADAKKLLKSGRLPAGTKIKLNLPDAAEVNIEPQSIELDIVYEDDSLIVVNKQKGMVVHPAPGNYDGTLVNALLYHCGDSLSGINGELRPGIVHRIDKDTSGLLVCAKTDNAHRALSEQLKEYKAERVYEAILIGRLKEKSFTVDAPIGRHRTDRKRMAVREDGRNAVSHFEVVTELKGYTHVRVTLETGRTHQIRIHSAYIGHPVLGDTVYGAGKTAFKLQGQCLHAVTLGFVHPESGEFMKFTCAPPAYFADLLKKLSQENTF